MLVGDPALMAARNNGLALLLFAAWALRLLSRRLPTSQPLREARDEWWGAMGRWEATPLAMCRRWASVLEEAELDLYQDVLSIGEEDEAR